MASVTSSYDKLLRGCVIIKITDHFHLDGFFQLYIFKVATVRYIVVKVKDHEQATTEMVPQAGYSPLLPRWKDKRPQKDD